MRIGRYVDRIADLFPTDHGYQIPTQRAKELEEVIASALRSEVVHKDTGFACLAYHGRGEGQCTKCSCGEWVRPRDWAAHVEVVPVGDERRQGERRKRPNHLLNKNTRSGLDRRTPAPTKEEK